MASKDIYLVRAIAQPSIRLTSHVLRHYGHVLASGPKTISSVPEFARVDRELFVLRSNMDPKETPKRFAGRIVFIGGGPSVWDAYARFVSHWDITRLPSDGPADRWFSPKWLTASA